MDETRRAGGRLAGPPLPPGVDVERRGDQLRGVRPPGLRCLGLPLRRGRHGDPAPAHRALAGHLARGAARGAGRRPLRLPGGRPVGPGVRAAVQPPQAAARPLRPRRLGRGDQRPGRLRLRRRQPGGAEHARLRAARPAQRGRRRRLRLARGHPAAPPLARHRDLRVPRQGPHRAARPGARGAPGHVRRPGLPRGRRLPARPRRDRRRAAAGPRVRLRAVRDRPRAHQLLGLQLDRLLRPAPRLLVVRRPRPAGPRVQGDGAHAARGRDRGAPRRRLQPHRRGRDARPDAVLPRPRRPRVLPAGAARRAGGRRAGAGLRRHLLGRHRLRQHRRTPPTRRRCG